MAIPEVFKAAVLQTPKAQNTIIDRSLGQLKPDEVGIRITATAINPVDWKMRDYDAFLSGYPAVLGSDAAGVVASVGSDVSNFSVGERVFFQGIIGTYDSSTFQQYCKMPAVLVSKTPDNITDDQAAGISLAIMAVTTAFYDKKGHGMVAPWDQGGAEAGKGKALVIIGGASSVGQYAIQLAKISGYDRIITNASAQNHKVLKELGADIILDRAQSSPEDFKAAIGNFPLEFIFDSISAKSTQILAVQILQATNTANSHVVTLHVVHPEDVDPEAVSLSQSQEPKVEVKQVLGIGSSSALRYLSEPLAKHLGGENGYIAKGLLKPNRPRVVQGGLEAVEEALALNKKGVSGEKVIFHPFE